jgi:hypothetical protein
LLDLSVSLKRNSPMLRRNTSALSSGSKSRATKKSAESGGKLTASAGFFLGPLFDPENGGDIFLPNVGLSPIYTALHPEDCAPQNQHISIPSIGSFIILPEEKAKEYTISYYE